MKKLLFSFVLITLLTKGFSQHHVKGTSAIDIGGGITKHGFFGDVNYNATLQNRLFLKGGILVESGKINSINYTTILGNIGTYYNFVKIGHEVYFNGGLGLTTKYDGINAFEGVTKETHLNYGGFAGVELEFYLGDKIGIIVDSKQMLYLSKKLDSKAWFVGTGIKYIL